MRAFYTVVEHLIDVIRHVQHVKSFRIVLYTQSLSEFAAADA